MARLGLGPPYIITVAALSPYLKTLHQTGTRPLEVASSGHSPACLSSGCCALYFHEIPTRFQYWYRSLQKNCNLVLCRNSFVAALCNEWAAFDYVSSLGPTMAPLVMGFDKPRQRLYVAI